MKSAFPAKYFLANKDLDTFDRLQSYTAQCQEKYSGFAQEVARVSHALNALQDSVPLTANQAELRRAQAAEEVSFPEYQRKALEGFMDRTQHYTEDAVYSMAYFAESVPHHIKKIETLIAAREKS